MNYGKKIGTVLSLFLFVGCFASAQEITWDGSSTDNDFMPPFVCVSGENDVAAQLKKNKFSVNGLQFEYEGTIDGDGYMYHYNATSNIGTPLYIILSDSFAVEEEVPFRLCSDARRRGIAEYFLQKGADPNGVLYHQKGNNTNRYQEGKNRYFMIDTALGRAARLGNLEIAEMLLRAGADPNFTWEGYWERTDDGRSVSWDYESSHNALEQVVLRADYPVNKRVQMIRLLTRYGADPNEVTRCGMTPLGLLVGRTTSSFGYSSKKLRMSEAKQMAQALLEAGADLKVKGKNWCDGSRGSGMVRGGENVKELLKGYSNERKEQWKEFFKKAGK